MESASINNLFLAAIESMGYSKEDQKKYLAVFDSKKKIQTITLIYSAEERKTKIHECLEELKSRHSLLNLLFLRYSIETMSTDFVDVLTFFTCFEGVAILESGFGSSNEHFLNNLLELVIVLMELNKTYKIQKLTSLRQFLAKILEKYDLVNKRLVFTYINMDVDRSPLLCEYSKDPEIKGSLNSTCLCSLFVKRVINDILALDKIEQEPEFLLATFHSEIKLGQLINEKYLMEIEGKFVNRTTFNKLLEAIRKDRPSGPSHVSVGCERRTLSDVEGPKNSKTKGEFNVLEHVATTTSNVKCEKAVLKSDSSNNIAVGVHLSNPAKEASSKREEELRKSTMALEEEIRKLKLDIENMVKSQMRMKEEHAKNIDDIKRMAIQEKIELNKKYAEKSVDASQSVPKVSVVSTGKADCTSGDVVPKDVVVQDVKSDVVVQDVKSDVVVQGVKKDVTATAKPVRSGIFARTKPKTEATVSEIPTKNEETKELAPKTEEQKPKISRLGARLGQKPKASILSSSKSYQGVKWKKSTKSQSQIFSKINYETCEKLFEIQEFDKFEFKQETIKPSPNKPGDPVKTLSSDSTVQVQHCMDPKKSYALNIALGRLKYDNKELVGKIVSRQFNDENIVRQLILYFPTREELSLINESKNPLSRAEMLFKEAGDMKIFYDSLVSLRFHFAFAVRDYETILQNLSDTFRRILESTELLGLFGVLLVIGNVLNSNTFNGNAEGFSLDSLEQFSNENVLKMVKTKISKSKLLQELNLATSGSISLIKDGIQVETIISEVNELKTLFVEESVDGKSKDGFQAVLVQFKEMSKYYKDAQTYFGEGDDKFITKIENFIRKL